MSTFYATMESVPDARNLVNELLRAGVRPDDVSLVTKENWTGLGSDQPFGSVGDATSFVGREDDPAGIPPIPSEMELTERTMAVQGPISGIDTSNTATNVEMIDQADDSQAIAESTIQPEPEISQAEHERDDLELAVHTGFPTPVPILDDVRDSETVAQEQAVDGLQAIVVPGVGSFVGGGALSTAALDTIGGSRTLAALSLIGHLKDEGMDEERARQYAAAYDRGMTILGIHSNPGDMDQVELEAIVSRHPVMETDFIDAPRFYEGGGKARML
jgi:hypothetical protein